MLLQALQAVPVTIRLTMAALGGITELEKLKSKESDPRLYPKFRPTELPRHWGKS